MTIRTTSEEIERSLQRTELYIALNNKESAQLKRNCLQKSQQLVTLIGNTFLTSKTGNFELSPYLANSILQVIEQQLTLVGLYQEEESFLQQFMTNIAERQKLASKLEQQHGQILRGSQISKGTIKEPQKAGSLEQGERPSFSIATDNERSQGTPDDPEYLKRAKQEEDWGTDEDEIVVFKPIAKVKYI